MAAYRGAVGTWLVAGLLLGIHIFGTVLVLGGCAGAALWGVLNFYRGKRLSPTYDRVLWLLQAALLLQVGTGAATLLTDRSTGAVLHLVYGSVCALLPGAGWLVVRGRRRVSLAMAVSCVPSFLAGLAAVASAG